MNVSASESITGYRYLYSQYGCGSVPVYNREKSSNAGRQDGRTFDLLMHTCQSEVQLMVQYCSLLNRSTHHCHP